MNLCVRLVHTTTVVCLLLAVSLACCSVNEIDRQAPGTATRRYTMGILAIVHTSSYYLFPASKGIFKTWSCGLVNTMSRERRLVHI